MLIFIVHEDVNEYKNNLNTDKNVRTLLLKGITKNQPTAVNTDELIPVLRKTFSINPILFTLLTLS